jgi:hypothetical protein
MEAQAVLRVMSFGKWSDRFGGEQAPYEYVDLYDPRSGEVFTWSLASETIEGAWRDATTGDRPAEMAEALVRFELTKQAKPGVAKVKQGERAGEVMDFVRESLKCRVLGFAPAPAKQPAKAAGNGAQKAAA